jgi:hypothetical protein
MKAFGIFIVIIFVAGVSHAQIVRGGFGQGFYGPWVMADAELYDQLSSPSLLGSNLQTASFGLSAGGSGYVLFSNRIVLGGTGFAAQASDATPRGQVTTKLGGGLGQVGFMIFQRNSLMGFPYLGLGKNNVKMKIRNNTANDVFDLGSLSVAPGESIELQAATVDLDLGFSLQYLPFRNNEKSRRSGLMIGVQAGAYVFGGIEDWHVKNEDSMVSGSLPRPAVFMPYFRITIGGGGFRFKNTDEGTVRR